MQRRAFLGTAVAAGFAGFAGCGASQQLTRPPEVPKQQLRESGWERQNAFTQKLFERRIGGQSVSAAVHTVRYTDQALRERVRERTFKQVDAPFGRFFASRVRITPSPSSLSNAARDRTVSILEEKAVSNFLDWLREDGVRSLERVGTGTLSVASGQTARLIDFEGELPLEDIPLSIAQGESVTVDLTPATVEGCLSLWQHDGTFFVSGGTYPAGNTDEIATERIAPGIKMSVQVDLGFQPASYRSELIDLMRQVG